MSRSLLLKIENPILLYNLSLLCPIYTKLGVWVAYVKRQLGIATQVTVVKVKVTLAKSWISISAY